MARASMLVLALAGASVLVATATAATIRGTRGGDVLVGTARADRLDAREGNDRIAVQYDGRRDSVRCGRGRDLVTADLGDVVARDCEVVSRRLSRDPYRNPESQHETQVEPDSFSFGSTIVTTFQSGRRFDGAASNIGWATSRDGGRTWRSGFLPGLTVFSTPAGTHARVSDPVVAYDALHAVWLIATLAVSPGATELFVSRSPDGLSWSMPISVTRSTFEDLAYDKEWITCDNGPRSAFRGRCYLVYTDHQQRRPRLVTHTTTDGGSTWSRPMVGFAGAVVGVVPVSRPDGTLVIPFLGDDQIEVVQSRDGGATFTSSVVIAELRARVVRGIRTPPIPTADVDAAGTVYVAWQDCRFQPACEANDIVLARSADGVSWSEPARVPTARRGAGLSHFVPGLAVEQTAAASPRVSVVYYWSPTRPCAFCVVNVGMISGSGGTTWGSRQRLNVQPMRPEWLPRTTSGRMLADYLSVSFVGRQPVGVYALASPRVGGRFRQAIFATQPLR